MTTPARTYGDACGTARALDLVGERWALLVVRELLLGPKRFTDLRAGLPNASPNVLAQRLRELEDGGVLARRTLPPPASARVYELTAWGLQLEPVVQALGRWGAQSPHGLEAAAGVDSKVLSLRALFDPAAAGDLETTVRLELDRQPFAAEISAGELIIERADRPGWEALIRTDPATLDELLFRGRSIADARRAGTLETEGDPKLVRRFLQLFPMPASAATAP
jgi:DNA-binding HxlR family transcriptional regulator